MIILVPLRSTIGNHRANHPKSMFQLSGVHYRGPGFSGGNLKGSFEGAIGAPYGVGKGFYGGAL